MSKYIKLEDAIGACRERQIIEGDAITGIRYPTSNEIINDLSDLPTIEVSEEELRKKYKDFYEQGKFDALVEVSEDAISREYMLEQVRKAEVDNGGTFGTDSEKVRIVIEHAPSVVPSRAEGEWKNEVIRPLFGKETKKTCSNCKQIIYDNGRCNNLSKGDWNYCPNCGAKMKG